MRIYVLAIACLAAAPVFAAGSAAHYTLSHKYVVGGDGGWDYLSFDADSHRLFVSRGNKLQVLDPDKDTLLGEIPTGEGAHGAIVAAELGKGFTSNGRGNSVTVFDLKTLKATNTIALSGQGPDAFAYEPVSKRVFFFNGHSNDVSVVDAVAEKQVAEIALDGRPEFAVVDGAGRVYVNIESKNELSEIDAAKAAVTKTWSIAP